MDKYICIDCKYETTKLKHYNQHCNTMKHKKNMNKKEVIPTLHVCEYCSKEYTVYNSLRYHIKKCKVLYEEILTRKILEKQKNDEIKELKKEMNEELSKINEKLENQEDEVKTLNEKIEKVKPIVFNLQVFLNEDCKNAISFNELLQQLQFHFDPSKTLTEDTSSTLLKTLTEMSLYERPIHCVDLKRHKLYIKDNDSWTDDNVFNKLPNYVYTEYKNHVNDWTEENPDFLENEQKMDVYITFTSKEVEDVNIEKIKRNISKVTTIPKKELKNE
jgi:hypothetical protein